VGKKMLVIGNDLFTEALLTQAFSDSGFQVLIISENGSSILPSGLIRPDLIILDSLLPGAPDWYILRSLRLLSPVPIVVLTEVEDSRVRIKSLNLGADYCLSKPLDLDELQAIVRSLTSVIGRS
jgi:DNA-binding response OmpR family regulator